MSERACAIGKDYAPASFKGVPFYCKEANAEGGRRGAEGEFPFGEKTAYADLGRKIRVYSLTAAFRRDDHVLDAQALFRVCESPGPGPLVHPTAGTVMVACRSVKVKDDMEGSAGETTADLEFVEANTSFLNGLAGALAGIVSSALNSASRGSFLANYRPVLVSQPWRKQIVDRAQGLIEVTAKVAKQTLDEDSPTDEWRSVLKMEEVVADDALATYPAKVEESLFTGFTTISEHVVDPKTRFNTFRRLANAGAHSSDLPAGIAVTSEEAVLSRHRVLAAIGMAEAALGQKYTYLDQGLVAMDAVLAVLRDEEKAAWDDCDNTLFLEIRKYSIAFAQLMNDLSYRLPGLIKVNFAGGVHPLVAAYVIYDDAKRHRELEERNIVDANGRFQPIVTSVAPNVYVPPGQ